MEGLKQEKYNLSWLKQQQDRIGIKAIIEVFSKRSVGENTSEEKRFLPNA